MMGWNVRLLDSDNHQIYVNGVQEKTEKHISIGNHVWIASEVSLLKGSRISDGSIVGYGSLVSRQFDEEDVIIVGTPAMIVKRNVAWKI
jgi:acetyltransferase-like isoleucine patch superfamily enzyme